MRCHPRYHTRRYVILYIVIMKYLVLLTIVYNYILTKKTEFISIFFVRLYKQVFDANSDKIMIKKNYSRKQT